MTKVIGVRFKANGKSYYFSPGDLELQQGDHVIVETARGTECGEVAKGPHDVPDSSIVKPLKTVTRMADAVDVRRMQQNRADEKRAFSVCEERIAKHKLDMKLVDVEYTLDRNKILFYFTADGRIGALGAYTPEQPLHAEAGGRGFDIFRVPLGPEGARFDAPRDRVWQASADNCGGLVVTVWGTV